MKRATQILTSILFVLAVLTAYFAFDFVINNAATSKQSAHKHSHHDHHHHNHDHPPDDIKLTKTRTGASSGSRSNRTLSHNDPEDENHVERHTRNLKQKQEQNALRAKPGSFPKGKTGVKVNKPKKSGKGRRKRLTTTTAKTSEHKDKRSLNDE